MSISHQRFDAVRFNAMLKIAVATAFVAVFSSSAFSGGPSPVTSVPEQDPAMSAAFARAAASLDDFLSKWRNPPPDAEEFMVKVGLTDSSKAPGYTVIRPGDTADTQVEFFWMGNLKEEGEGFSAQVANIVEYLRNVHPHDTVHFKRSDIADWMYFRDGKIVGNATACPALAHASAAERREMKERYGLVCE